MATTNHGVIQAGDWVSGTSQMDEKFIGFVYSVPESGFLKVWVTQCDRDETVGTIVEAKLSKVKSLPDSAPSSPEEVHSLIDLALMTHDEEWFAELRAKLTATSSAAKGGSENRREHKLPQSRLFGTLPQHPLDDEAA